MQGSIWEASVGKESKDRALKQLLPVSHLVSASRQTFPPCSYPFPPISPSVSTRVLLSSTAAAFLRLQAYSWNWLLHNSIPLSPACLEKHSERDLCFWQKSRERGAMLLENGPRVLSSVTALPLLSLWGQQQLSFPPSGCKTQYLAPSSPEAASLSVAAHEWVEKDESSFTLTQLFLIWSLGLWTTRWTTVIHILTYSHVLKG